MLTLVLRKETIFLFVGPVEKSDSLHCVPQTWSTKWSFQTAHPQLGPQPLFSSRLYTISKQVHDCDHRENRSPTGASAFKTKCGRNGHWVHRECEELIKIRRQHTEWITQSTKFLNATDWFLRLGPADIFLSKQPIFISHWTFFISGNWTVGGWCQH